MRQNHRHQQLVEYVQAAGFVTIEQLSEHFAVTPQTIRRDVNQLAEQNLLSRHHGGAVANSSTANSSHQARQIMGLEEKQKIAAQVAEMIPNGASLFINIGTTTEAIAKALLQHQDLKVVTNNIHVASILSAKEDFSVIIAAGEVRHRDGGIIGEATCDFIQQFRMDFGIIGISGISLDGSLLEFDYREVKVAQAIIGNSQQVVLAADQSKFGRSAMIKQGNISQVDHFFTDAEPPAEINDILQQHTVQKHIVS